MSNCTCEDCKARDRDRLERAGEWPYSLDIDECREDLVFMKARGDRLEAVLQAIIDVADRVEDPDARRVVRLATEAMSP